MRAVILAAGSGTRLRPLTDKRPKCKVELLGFPLLKWQIASLHQAGIRDITVVAGYMAELVEGPGYHTVVNAEYDRTNMVETLFCARESLRGDTDLLITYGDIVYEPRVIAALQACNAPICLAVDQEWLRYWQMRFTDPLSDAETLKIAANGMVHELGKKTNKYADIHAQYMGLIKVKADHVELLEPIYRSMDRAKLYDGKDYHNMYMTSFLQHLIEQGWPVRAVLVDNGWLEVDSVADLELYHRLAEEGTLGNFFDLGCLKMTTSLLWLLEILPAPRGKQDCFSTEFFLFDLAQALPQSPSDEGYLALERLCKKVDVVRHIHAFYSPDLTQPLGNESIAPTYLALLAAVLLQCAEIRSDPKFLNSALKLLDGHVNRIPADLAHVLSVQADALLEKVMGH